MNISATQSSQEIARLSARILLEIKAVHFNAADPFTLASGLPSPTYIDCRKVISFPRVRNALMDFMCQTLTRDAGFEAFDNIAGGETAGIPFAALVAERLGLPMSYVRKKPKGYGRNARIEGNMFEGQRVLLVEDLTTDGGSKLSFVDAIRETGASCSHTAVIFNYGIFPETKKVLGDHGVTLHALCTWWDVWPKPKPNKCLTPTPRKRLSNSCKRPVTGSTHINKSREPNFENTFYWKEYPQHTQNAGVWAYFMLYAVGQSYPQLIHRNIQFAQASLGGLPPSGINAGHHHERDHGLQCHRRQY